jgi:type III restriction enzyme
VSVLALDRYRLRDQIEARIQQHREQERKAALQLFLLPNGPLETSEEQAINFKTLRYEPGWRYEGGFQFQKHYFGPPGELREITPGGALTEEFKCAQFLDQLPEVQSWIRNLARKTTSFRLQTSSDWFYPDFLCRLNDGRTVVVEYKGKDRYDTADAEEKRAVGAVWESRSGGRCRFVMPTSNDFTPILKAVRTA